MLKIEAMQLPGRLRATTLGDVLGALHRERASGTLELVEQSGRTHRVHLTSGLVIAVELDRASASLAEILRRNDEIDEDTLRRSLLRAMASRRLHGEVLVRDFHLSPEIIGRALRNQIMIRLAALDDVPDAQLLFRVTVRHPRGALVDAPLGANEFLAGKKRARDRGAEPTRPRAAYTSMPGGWDPARATACRVLGVTLGADPASIKQAYRRLVRAYHPDLHPGVSQEERKSLAHRFAEVADAYKTLSA